MYRFKRNPYGSITHHKARWVDKGYHQQEGINFEETFNPVVKKPTVQIILPLAAQFDWKLSQLDVKNAFLHGELREEVYIQQPQCFINNSLPNHVCKFLSPFTTSNKHLVLGSSALQLIYSVRVHCIHCWHIIICKNTMIFNDIPSIVYRWYHYEMTIPAMKS